jgi:hypothetical protein
MTKTYAMHELRTDKKGNVYIECEMCGGYKEVPIWKKKWFAFLHREHRRNKIAGYKSCPECNGTGITDKIFRLKVED